MARGINNKFVKTATPGSEERLHTLKLDELINAYNTLADKLDTLAAKLDADAGVTDTDYQSSAAITDTKLSKTVSDELIPSPSQLGT